jgi:aspartate racemase
LEDVRQAYITMAASGIVTEAQRNVFDTVSQRLLVEQGAEAIIAKRLLARAVAGSILE